MKRTTAVMTILGTIVAIYFPVAGFLGWFPFMSSPKLELSKYIVSDSWGNYPLLDVTIKNTGQETAVLDRVSFELEEVATLSPNGRYTFMQTPISGKYEIEFHLQGNGASGMELHHDVREQEPDRITFSLKHDAGGQHDKILRLKGRLTYDDGKRIEFPPMLIIASRPAFGSKYNATNEDAKEKLKNVASLVDLKSENLQSLIRDVVGNISNTTDSVSIE